MNNQVQEKLELFADNAQSIRNNFIWQSDIAKRLAALAYSLESRKIDGDAIKSSHNMIKSETGVFSSFRGNLAIYMAAALSLHSQPETILADTLYVYDLLKQQGFWSSDYLVVTAYEIAVNTEKTLYPHKVQRTREFYDEMKSNHRFHIGKDDYIFAAMLALTDMDVHAGANKLKKLYLRLKPEFGFFIGANSILTLSQMLILGDSTEECVLNLLRLNRTLKKRKIRMDKTYTLPSLGVLGILGADNNALVDDLIGARDYLRNQKGFGHFSVSTQELLLYAVSLVTHVYAESTESNIMKAGVTTSITNLLIAQQVAMIASISAVSAGAAASS